MAKLRFKEGDTVIYEGAEFLIENVEENEVRPYWITKNAGTLSFWVKDEDLSPIENNVKTSDDLRHVKHEFLKQFQGEKIFSIIDGEVILVKIEEDGQIHLRMGNNEKATDIYVASIFMPSGLYMLYPSMESTTANINS